MSKKPCSFSLTPNDENEPCTLVINSNLRVKDDALFKDDVKIKEDLNIENIIYDSEIIDETGETISNEKSLSFINTSGDGLLPNGLHDGIYKKILKVDDSKDWQPIGMNSIFSSGVIRSIAFDPITGEGPYIGGDWDSINGDTGLSNFVFWNGSKWTSLNNTGDGIERPVFNVKFNPITGEGPYIGGAFTKLAGDTSFKRIAKWDKSTQSWDTLDPIQSRNVYNITFNPISGDGPYIVGNFSESSLDSIAKWDEASTSWTSIKPSGDSVSPDRIRINAIAFSPTGFGPYIGGDALDEIDGITGPIHFAFFDGTDWAILGNTGDFNNTIETMAFNQITGEGPYIGGNFTNVAGITGLDHLTKWDSGSSSWTSIGNTGDFKGLVRTIAFGPSGEGPYVGGSFKNVSGISTLNKLVKWDSGSSSWTSIKQGGDIFLPNDNGVFDIKFSNDNIIHISGNFLSISNKNINKIAKLTSEYKVYYNGPSYDDFEILTNIGDCVSFLYNEDLGEWIKLNEV